MDLFGDVGKGCVVTFPFRVGLRESTCVWGLLLETGLQRTARCGSARNESKINPRITPLGGFQKAYNPLPIPQLL